MNIDDRCPCGQIDVSDVGREVALCGWVDALRGRNQSLDETRLSPERFGKLLLMLAGNWLTPARPGT